jgi:sulfopyruvate decarboxylase TPP-binding subunit
MSSLSDAAKFTEALTRLEVTHVIWLPDACTGRWEHGLASSTQFSLIRVCREGEAWAIAAGLWLGGQRPMVVIQNTGLFESGDALRNVLFELEAPLYALIGYRNYLVSGSRDTAKRFTEPILQAWQLDYIVLDQSDWCRQLTDHFRVCQSAGRPGIALLPEGRG